MVFYINSRPQWRPECVQRLSQFRWLVAECQQWQGRQQVQWRQSVGFPRKSLIFFLNYFVEEVFCICPLHPPSIFPISSSFIERLIYFLLSNDFVSHRIISSIFNASSFLIEKLIQGSFSVLFRKLAMDIPSMISTNKESIFCPSVCL
jgi:hypothetical protein